MSSRTKHSVPTCEICGELIYDSTMDSRRYCKGCRPEARRRYAKGYYQRKKEVRS